MNSCDTSEYTFESHKWKTMSDIILKLSKSEASPLSDWLVAVYMERIKPLLPLNESLTPHFISMIQNETDADEKDW